jgi:hypothetical protein
MAMIKRKHGDLWVFDDAINGRQKIWVGGELVALFHKPQAVANGTSSASTICIDLRATDLNDAMAYIKQACNSIAQKVADDKVPPRKEPDDGDGSWLRPKEVDLFKDNTWNAGGEAAFEAVMGPGRQALEEGHVAQGVVKIAALIHGAA